MEPQNMGVLGPAIGGFIAGVVGLVLFFVQRRYHARDARRRVARALLKELIPPIINIYITRKELAAGRSGEAKITAAGLRLAIPVERKIYSVIGGEIGVLSDQAIHSTVVIDSELQEMERNFREYVALLPLPDDHLETEDCDELIHKVAGVKDRLLLNLEHLADDAYGSVDQAPEDTRELIQSLRSM